MLKKTLSAILLSLFAAVAVCAQDISVPVRPAQPGPKASQTPPQATPTPQPQEPKDQKAQPAGKNSPSEAKKKYEALLEKAKKGEGAIDFKGLRFAYFETPDYNPLAGMINYRGLWGSLAPGKYPEAVKAAESVLEKNYVDVNAHMVAFIAYRETGEAEKARYHRTWAEGLLNSIKSAGDGLSTDTAFEVISVSEEYAFFRSMGVQPVSQSLVRDKGHAFDAVVVVEPKTNRQVTYYFNVDKPFSAYGRK